MAKEQKNLPCGLFTYRLRWDNIRSAKKTKMERKTNGTGDEAQGKRRIWDTGRAEESAESKCFEDGCTLIVAQLFCMLLILRG